MQLTREALEEFKALWMETHPDEPLSREELLTKATTVMTAVQILWQPIPEPRMEEVRTP